LRPPLRRGAQPELRILPPAPKIDRLGQVDGVPNKKALAALKEAKRKLDDLYREVTSRKASVLDAAN